MQGLLDKSGDTINRIYQRWGIGVFALPALLAIALVGLAMKFIELLCTRLRRTSDQVEEVILQNLPGRLASALLRLTEKHKPGGRTIAITQQEISEMVGMSRESINKQLRAWAARNWVRLEHGAIVVLNAEMLQELAEAGSDEGD